MTAPEQLGSPVRQRVDLVKHYLDGDEWFPAVLVWLPSDPVAVKLLFQAGARWEFARDLLVDALAADKRVGDGDVRFYPDGNGPTSEDMLVELVGVNGRAVYTVTRAVLAGFVTDTERQAGADPIAAVDAWLAAVIPSC